MKETSSLSFSIDRILGPSRKVKDVEGRPKNKTTPVKRNGSCDFLTKDTYDDRSKDEQENNTDLEITEDADKSLITIGEDDDISHDDDSQQFQYISSKNTQTQTSRSVPRKHRDDFESRYCSICPNPNETRPSPHKGDNLIPSTLVNNFKEGFPSLQHDTKQRPCSRYDTPLEFDVSDEIPKFDPTKETSGRRINPAVWQGLYVKENPLVHSPFFRARLLQNTLSLQGSFRTCANGSKSSITLVNGQTVGTGPAELLNMNVLPSLSSTEYVRRVLNKGNLPITGLRSPTVATQGLSFPWVDMRKDRLPLIRRASQVYHSNRCHAKRKKPRTSFTRLQIMELEKRFHRQKYLASNERSSLAKTLKMTDAQVKTWFQNRRTKWRRQTAEERDAERQAATRLMLTLHTDPTKSMDTQPDPVCLANSSLHALQNLQPWSDDEDTSLTRIEDSK